MDWHELGIYLEVPKHKLNNIGRENPTEARKLSEVLQYWLNNGEASWEMIIEALEKIGDHANIIETIQLKYPSGMCTIERIAVEVFRNYC